MKVINAKDKFKFKQLDITRGQLEAELVLKLKLRPSGWSGNDKYSLHPIAQIVNLLNSILDETAILDGDETISYSAKWRRPNQHWQSIQIVDDPQEKIPEAMVGIQEIAFIANVKTPAVSNWRTRFSDFPKPVADLAAGPVFLRWQTLAWLKKKRKIKLPV
jgi:hypothetical protein